MNPLTTAMALVLAAGGALAENWNITDNWFLQALMWSQDKPTVEGNDFQLDSHEGLAALDQIMLLKADRCRISCSPMRPRSGICFMGTTTCR